MKELIKVVKNRIERIRRKLNEAKESDNWYACIMNDGALREFESFLNDLEYEEKKLKDGEEEYEKTKINEPF